MRCFNSDELYAFTNFGNCIKISLDDCEPVDWRASGIKIDKTFDGLQSGEYPVKLLSKHGRSDGELIMFTKQGAVKRTLWSEFEQIRKVAPAIKLKQGDDAFEQSKFLTTTSFPQCCLSQGAQCVFPRQRTTFPFRDALPAE